MKKIPTRPASAKPAAKKAVAKKPTAKNPAAKKPAQKKPATKTSPSKPKRKAQGQSELTQVTTRLDAIMDKLNELLERGTAPLTTPPAFPNNEPLDQLTDEHGDNSEGAEPGSLGTPASMIDTQASKKAGKRANSSQTRQQRRSGQGKTIYDRDKGVGTIPENLKGPEKS